MDNKELNLNEMEAVSGGRGGSPTYISSSKYDTYRIESGATLTRIANRFHTTIDYLMSINPTITNRNDITAGYYMFVPKQR